MKKVSIIGAGNVGATAAQEIARLGICDEVVLLDIKEGFAEGKAMDISQSLYVLGEYEVRVAGTTGDYSRTKDSDVVIITSGVPRKAGMTREDLVTVNENVVKSVLKEVHESSPEAVIVMVSNPLDTMTYLGVKYLASLGKEDAETKVIGMGGTLDTARLQYYQSEVLGISPAETDGVVIGAHGDSMIPISCGVPFETEEQVKTVIESTRTGGAKLTSLLGTSAWMAPAASIAKITRDIISDRVYLDNTCSIYIPELDVCIGTVVNLGESGVVSYNIPEEEDYAKLWKESVEEVRKTNSLLHL